MTLRLRRGTDAERQSIVFDEGELVFVTDTKQLYAGDGSTLGGILVSNIASPSELTQDLDLNGFDIIGPGTISATAFVGDGSGLTNIPGGEGVIPGSDYRINIVGDDSTIIVNGATNAVTGIFFGDGSNLSNLDFNGISDVSIIAPVEGEILTYSGGNWINLPPAPPEIVEGGDYRINIIGSDSTRLVDGDTGTFTGDLRGSVYLNDSTLIVDTFGGGTINSALINATNLDLEGSGVNPILKIVSEVNTGTFGLPVISINNSHTGTSAQEITFNRSNGTFLSPTSIQPGNFIGSITYRAHDGVNYSTVGAMHVVADNIGGTDDISTSVRFLTRNGSRLTEYGTAFEIKPDKGAKVTGYLTVGGYTPVERDALVVDQGTVIFNETSRTIDFNDGVEWMQLISATINDGSTDFPGPIVIGGITEAERDLFGNDSTVVSRAIIYNTTTDRFEFFQAGSWITLANQNLDETSDVRFNTVTADSFVSTGAGTPTLESATNLDLQAGNAVRVIGSPFRLANLTTTERNALTPANGDLIYNTTTNRIQAYQNGAWINLDDGTAA